MTTTEIGLSVIVPIHNEDTTLGPLFERLLPVLSALTRRFEVLCINDGSTDDSLRRLIEWHAREPRITVVNLSRRFGKEAALTAGLDLARGRAVVVIDADLQDPPELIPEMVDAWRDGHDVVMAHRRSRAADPPLKRLSARLFYRLQRLLAEIEVPADVGDFRLLDARVVAVLRRLPERQRFMKGLFAWVGFRTTTLDYEREARLDGHTKFNLWRLWNFALEGFTSFSTAPLRMWTYLGIAVSMSMFVYALVMIVRVLLHGIDIPGYASLIVVVLFLGGLQLIGIGLLGEYLGRTYFETKQRPIYVIRDVIGTSDNPPERPRSLDDTAVTPAEP